jgi:hypothetical protein
VCDTLTCLGAGKVSEYRVWNEASHNDVSVPGNVGQQKIIECSDLKPGEAGKMSTSRVKWPTVGQKGGNQEEHVHHLKTEAQQLMATMKAPTPENKNTKRGLPHEQAAKFLKSWLDWVQKEEGRTYGDPVLEAIQRLERLIETRSPARSGGSQGGEYGGSGGRSWAQVAGAGGAGGTANTGFNKNTTTSSKLDSPSIAQGDPCGIRIRMNNSAISAEIRQKPNTSEYILKTVNYQISQSENINKDP